MHCPCAMWAYDIIVNRYFSALEVYGGVKQKRKLWMITEALCWLCVYSDKTYDQHKRHTNLVFWLTFDQQLTNSCSMDMQTWGSLCNETVCYTNMWSLIAIPTMFTHHKHSWRHGGWALSSLNRTSGGQAQLSVEVSDILGLDTTSFPSVDASMRWWIP